MLVMEAEVERLRKENMHLRCVMQEAAHELHSFWEFHASEGGLGPYRLLNMLSGKERVEFTENPYPQHEAAVKCNNKKGV